MQTNPPRQWTAGRKARWEFNKAVGAWQRQPTAETRAAVLAAGQKIDPKFKLP